MTDFSIRASSLEDAALMARLHAESFGADCWSESQLYGSLILPTTQGWIATLDATPVGFILCQTLSEEAEVLTFCVSPSYRHKGIGQKLLHAALAYLPEGVPVYLEVAEDNGAARSLYEKECFEINGLRKNYYHRGDQKISAILYLRSNRTKT